MWCYGPAITLILNIINASSYCLPNIFKIIHLHPLLSVIILYSGNKVLNL